MATVGPKAQKRNLRKSVNEISIPKVCLALQANDPLLLRVSSNLLYGLSLLYKQKVGFMASDVSLVHDRLNSQFSNNPIFYTTGALVKTASIAERKRGKIDLIKDDLAFDLERDFAHNWSQSLIPANGDEEFLSSVIEIQRMDRLLNGIDASTIVKDLGKAQIRDQLFNVYSNQTFDTTFEEEVELDFEFDENGNIVTSSNRNPVLQNFNILGDLNIDEDFTATVDVIEDLSKSVNSITNDPSYVTTLNQTAATIVNPHQASKLPKKRRLAIDYITLSGARQFTDLQDVRYLRLNEVSPTLPQLIRSISTKKPQFINLCYRLLLGPKVTEDIPTHALPLAARHPTVYHIESFLREIDDIERGRDVRSRRPSLSFVDDVLDRIGEVNNEDLLGLDFTLETLSPMEEDEDLIDGRRPGKSSDMTAKLKDFEQFLRDRTYLISNREAEEERISTFGNLIPSLDSKVEESVSRKIAAQSFLYVLELATKNVVKLTTLQDGPTMVSKVFAPIEIAFPELSE